MLIASGTIVATTVTSTLLNSQRPKSGIVRTWM